MRITHDEYITIKSKLENRVREAIKEEKQEGIRIKDLVEWYIDQHLDEIDSEQGARIVTLKIRSIINKIILQENTLVWLSN